MAKRPTKAPAPKPKPAPKAPGKPAPKLKAPVKKTPSQQRKAIAKKVEKMLPVDPVPKGKGVTVVPDDLLKKVKEVLEK